MLGPQLLHNSQHPCTAGKEARSTCSCQPWVALQLSARKNHGSTQLVILASIQKKGALAICWLYLAV